MQQYENTLGFKKDNRQYIITPQTASHLVSQDVASSPTGSRCPQMTDDTDVIRRLQMNTGKTGITSTDTHEQEHPQNTLKFKNSQFPINLSNIDIPGKNINCTE